VKKNDDEKNDDEKNDDDKGIASLDEEIQKHLDEAARWQRFKELRASVGGGADPTRQWLCPRCYSPELWIQVPFWGYGPVNQASPADQPLLEETFEYIEIEEMEPELWCSACWLVFVNRPELTK
jgi:hypothetical protein